MIMVSQLIVTDKLIFQIWKQEVYENASIWQAISMLLSKTAGLS